MAWQQLIFHSSSESAESLSDLLMGRGALSVTFEDAGDQAIFEPSLEEATLWDNTRVIGLFPEDIDIQHIATHIAEQLTPSPQYTIEALPDQDWERTCMQDFHAMQYGKRLWVCPSWEAVPDPDAITILLDPGLAFGTGTHETTSLCLEWLEQHLKTDNTLIDYGCGSGILGIAAKKLGAAEVVGVDIHPQAIEATQQNASNNDIEITATLPEDFEPIQADVLIANILAQPLLQLAETFSTLVKTNGKIVLSGILATQANSIVEVYQTWFELDDVVVKNEWCLVSGRKRVAR